MPRLPDVTTYGQRPSLRTNRVDPVHPEGVEIAESVASAAAMFAREFGKGKGKDDRTRYALAKNEILALDIAQRESLKDRDDHAAFDDDYTTGFNTGRDEVLNSYTLTPSDSALLSSESDLIREKGRVYAGDLARNIEVDQGRAQVIRDLDAALELIQVAPPKQQNDLMFQALETVMAASDSDGRTPWFTEQEAENMIQSFASKAAVNSLEAMTPEQRKAELTLSLAHRKARGAITREDIEADDGSGSIADFLHSNVAQKMLDEADKEDEIEKEVAEAQEIVDEIEALNPGDDKAYGPETRKLARERGSSSTVRARAEAMARSRAEEVRVNRNADRSETMVSMGNLLGEQDDDGRFVNSMDNLPANQLRKLTPTQVAQLTAFESNLRNGSQFGTSSNWHQPQYNDDGGLDVPSYSAWAEMTPAQKEAINLESPEWFNNFEGPVWKQMADEQIRIRSGKTAKEKSIQTNDQILTDVWAGEMGLPRTGRDADEEQNYYIARSKMASLIDQASDAEFSGQAVPDERRKEIARQVLGEQVWVRDQGLRGHIWGRDGSSPVSASTIDPDNYRDYFVPIKNWRNLKTLVRIGPNAEPVEMTWEQKLKNIAETELDGRVPNQKDLENAYAQIIIGGEPGLVQQRVLEALGGGYEY